MPPSRRWLPGRVPALPGCSRQSLSDVPAGIAIGMIATARQTAHQWTYRDDLALEKHTRPLAEVLTGNGLVLLERLHLRPQLATLRIDVLYASFDVFELQAGARARGTLSERVWDRDLGSRAPMLRFLLAQVFNLPAQPDGADDLLQIV